MIITRETIINALGLEEDRVRPVLPEEYKTSEIREIPHTPLAAANYYTIESLRNQIDTQALTIDAQSTLIAKLQDRIEALEREIFGSVQTG